MSKNVNLALLGTLDTTTPEQFLVSTGPDTTPNFQNISLLPSGNTNFIAGSGVTLNQSGITAQFSQLTCPQWHIGQTGKMLARESTANRISQQVSLSANFLRHIQYVVSLNPPVTGAEILTTPGGTYGGGTAHVGGVLMADGRVYCVPDNVTIARIYDPNKNILTTPSGSFPAGTSNYAGGVLMTDGRVFCVPWSATVARIYNPATDTLTLPTGTYPGGQSQYGGVLMADGRVFCVPNLATVARIYDPVTDTLSTPNGGCTGHAGGVLMLDGRVFCVPHQSTVARIYNPFTDTFTTPAGTYPGGTAHAGGVLLPDGRVFCIPFSTTVARIYNPDTNTLTTPQGTYPTGIGGGTLLPDGRVFCSPAQCTIAVIYDPATNTTTTPAGTYTAFDYVGAIRLLDGTVFLVPDNALTSRIIKIQINSNFSPAATTGPFHNKQL